MPDVHAFIERWKNSDASERANYQLFLSELCDVLGVPRPEPATHVVADHTYGFERPVTFDDGAGKTSTGFIDLYKRDCFVLEAKQGSVSEPDAEAARLGLAPKKRKHGTAPRGTRAWERAMNAAKNQAHRYARALPPEDGWPPFLVVVDVGYCFDLYADFQRQGKAYLPFPDPQTYRIALEDLVREDVRERLRLLWTDPLKLDPAMRQARITRHLAARLARLAASLEAAGDDPHDVAHFIMRCLFTMFAEDVGLLPERAFTDLLAEHHERPGLLTKMLRDLWEKMNTGGFSAAVRADVRRFNGGLFADPRALPLSAPQIELLREAAEADWRDVEPAIFGTLLERALDPVERHKLGAHFTPRAYVERLVLPAVVEPLREAWEHAKTAASLREAEAGQAPNEKERRKKEAQAREEILAFHRRLCALRVLDPACGSGNFLYVTLEHLKRLEGEVLRVLEGYTGGQILLGEAEAAHDLTEGRTVTPRQFLGLEVNPRAAAIADVVLWIGYLQWHLRATGDAERLQAPLLRDYHNIRERDAVLAFDERRPRTDADGRPVTRWDGRTTKRHPVTGREVPDETARVSVFDYVNPRPAPWPEADFIVGNPPFIGKGGIMRDALGDGYTEALRKAYPDVPDSADFVMYWWHKAAGKVRRGEAERFGFITTNSLRQTFNRRVVQAHLHARPPLSLVFAVPDHPWVDGADGADVRIAMTVGARGEREGRLLTVTAETRTDGLGRDVAFRETTGKIRADLTVGPDVVGAVPLKANAGICAMGVKLHGSGFIVTPEEAASLGLGRIEGLEKHIRPYRNGRDLTQTPRGVMVIDLYGLTEEEVRARFPEVYQWVYERVKPERDQNRDRKMRENWWLHGRSRPELRDALEGLSRYIATVETSKHRFFVFLDAAILPDNMLVNVASEDAWHLGVLSSRIHVVWALATGGRLGVGNDPRYNKTRCFETFPFPGAGGSEAGAIRALGEALDAHRKARLAAHPKLTMTGMYNVLAKLRAGAALTPKEQAIHEQGLVSVLRTLHDDLDAAVSAAYGWPPDLSEAELLERLVALNRARAEEEARGFVRYLRPEYQNPEGARQTALGVGPSEAKAATPSVREPWPKTLPERVGAVQRVLEAAAGPLAPEAVARRFTRARTPDVAAVLETLAHLGHLRRVDGRYAA